MTTCFSNLLRSLRSHNFFLSLLLVVAACAPQVKEQAIDEPASLSLYQEQHRPVYHFTPAQNWTNDPNGLVYHKGEYHLYYQYNPYANHWGHMSWGHAVSTDLVQWKHLPVAIPEYLDANGDSVMIFSGSAVADVHNTSKLFAKDSSGLVAIFTSHVHPQNREVLQYQSIAFSKDDGRSFQFYQQNPVLDLKRKDFRDPKVFWYEPQKKWVMAVVIPDQYKVQFYESKNLIQWNFLSDFGPLGDTTKIWECPDLSEVQVEGEGDQKKWLLLVSTSHPQGGTFVGMQYFVGNFDGKTFTVDDPQRYPLYVDHGKDFYAGVTYNHLPLKGRNVMVGWINNWAYAGKLPTNPWKGAMSLPRELTLRKNEKAYWLIQRPARELHALRGEYFSSLVTVDDASALELIYEVTAANASQFGLTLSNSRGDRVTMGYDQQKKEVFIDRKQSGNLSFDKNFASRDAASVDLPEGRLKLHVFIDHSIIEVYVNDGERVLTDQFFPTSRKLTIKTFATGGVVEENVQAWKMASIWR